jgi:putative serine protease PepD
VEFGVELSCGDCGWRRGVPGAVFQTGVFPAIESVEKDGPADRAGLLPGDVMISVEGVPITATEAGRRLGALEPSEAVTLEIRRGDRIIQVTLTPREATRRRQRM